MALYWLLGWHAFQHALSYCRQNRHASRRVLSFLYRGYHHATVPPSARWPPYKRLGWKETIEAVSYSCCLPPKVDLPIGVALTAFVQEVSRSTGLRYRSNQIYATTTFQKSLLNPLGGMLGDALGGKEITVRQAIYLAILTTCRSHTLHRNHKTIKLAIFTGYCSNCCFI